jgi:hypothetical protein
MGKSSSTILADELKAHSRLDWQNQTSELHTSTGYLDEQNRREDTDRGSTVTQQMKTR